MTERWWGKPPKPRSLREMVANLPRGPAPGASRRTTVDFSFLVYWLTKQGLSSDEEAPRVAQALLEEFVIQRKVRAQDG